MEDRSCQTQVKGSVTSCDLGINPHFFTTPVDSLKAKRQLGPLDDDIVPKKRFWRREETAVLEMLSFNSNSNCTSESQAHN